MLACAYPALDLPMMRFQDVVEILHRSMPAVLLQSVLGFEPHDGRWITGVLVGVDDPPRRMDLSAQRSWRDSAQPLLHPAWAREGSRSSHRWSRQPGKNTPTCP